MDCELIGCISGEKVKEAFKKKYNCKKAVKSFKALTTFKKSLILRCAVLMGVPAFKCSRKQLCSTNFP